MADVTSRRFFASDDRLTWSGVIWCSLGEGVRRRWKGSWLTKESRTRGGRR